MGRLYIYLHENHKNQANVGKYTVNIPYMGAIGYDKPPGKSIEGFNKDFRDSEVHGLKHVKSTRTD